MKILPRGVGTMYRATTSDELSNRDENVDYNQPSQLKTTLLTEFFQQKIEMLPRINVRRRPSVATG